MRVRRRIGADGGIVRDDRKVAVGIGDRAVTGHAATIAVAADVRIVAGDPRVFQVLEQIPDAAGARVVRLITAGFVDRDRRIPVDVDVGMRRVIGDRNRELAAQIGGIAVLVGVGDDRAEIEIRNAVLDQRAAAWLPRTKIVVLAVARHVNQFVEQPEFIRTGDRVQR